MEKILTKLQGLSITLSKNGDQIDVYDPKDNLTASIVQEIKMSKTEILDYLGKSEVPIVYKAIPKAVEKESYPLSPAQKRLFYLYELDKNSLAYNMPQIYRVKGNLKKERLMIALQGLINRHESLRTNFKLRNEEPVQVVREDSNFEVTYFEGSEAEIDTILNKFIAPFDLGVDCLVRVGLIKLGEKDNILMFDIHHIIGDGVSNGILVNDFRKLYDDEQLPSLRLQYKDYVTWQETEAQQKLIKQGESFWLNTFQETTVLELPLDFKRPHIKNNAGATVSFKLNDKDTECLAELARVNGTTLFMTVFTIFNTLLYKLTNQQDIVIGIPIRGRDHIDLEEIIGMFVNTLPVKSNIDGTMSFVELLAAISKNTLNCFDYQSYPYDELIEALKLKRTSNRNPLFDVSFTFDSFGNSEEEITGLRFEGYEKKIESSKFDLSLIASEFNGSLNLLFEYDTNLFEYDTINRFSDYFKAIVDQLLKDRDIKLSNIDMLSKPERKMILEIFNNTKTKVSSEVTILELFDQQIQRCPNDIAIRFEDVVYTFKELNERANQVANYLHGIGVVKEQLIPVYLERSAEMVVAILGVLKSGAAYVPIDPVLPKNRIEYMLNDIDTSIILTQGSLKSSFLSKYHIASLDEISNDLDNEPSFPPDIELGPNSLSYVIYTSGTTGKPKGVMGEHKGIVNMVSNHLELVNLTPADKVLQFASFSFDAFVWELFSSLISGAELIIPKREVINSIEEVCKLIKTAQITHVTLPPSYQAFLMKETHQLRVVVSAGEPLKPEFVNAFSEKGVKLVNAYGPTENTVCSTLTFEPLNKGRVTIGKPLNGVKAYILDDNNNLCALGCVGELCVSGLQLARGYLNAPELSLKSFVQNPYGEGVYNRLYKTGDLARWMPDGNIEFLGRKDDQVKIRGYRIELGEIENALRAVPEIKDGIVLPDENRQMLVAYYTLAEPQSNPIKDGNFLKKQLAEFLPEYMIPSNFIMLDELPLTSNGKVDSKTLIGLTNQNSIEKPLPGVESYLLEIWSEVLELDRLLVGRNSDFFELGGQSLKAMTLTNRINKEFSVNLQIDEIFSNSTIALLAECMSQENKYVLSEIPKAEEKTFYKMSSAQLRMYFLHQLEPESTAYNMPQFYKISGTVDLPFIESIFYQLVERHESLRTVFGMMDGKIAQKIIEPDNFEIQYYKWEEASLKSGLKEFVRPFRLDREYPIRIGLVALESDENLLLVDMHHIISDALTHEILLRDFWKLYMKISLEPLKLQYKDFAEWQGQPAQQELIAQQKTFWQELYRTVPADLELPLDYQRPAIKGNNGASISFNLNEQESTALRQIARDEGTTLFVLMLSLYNVLLAKLSNQEDIVIGVPSSGRSSIDLEGVVGIFLNMLPIRNSFSNSMIFNDFLKTVKQHMTDCMANQLYQYNQLLDLLKLERDTSRNPLFDTIFTYQEGSAEKFEQQLDIRLDPIQEDLENSKVDMEMFVSGGETSMNVNIIYCKSLFGRQRMKGLVKSFQEIINQVIANKNIKISDMNILSDLEKQEIVSDLKEDSRQSKIYNTSIVEMFEEIALRNPENVALKYGEKLTFYEELNAKANQFANYLLQNQKVSSGDIVGIKFKNPENLMTCMLGVLKAGATYLPLDDFAPTERIQYMLSDSGATCIVLDDDENGEFALGKVLWDESKWANKDKENIDLEIDPEQSVYVIYTSGTTGRPKGTCVPNRALVNYISWFKSNYDVDTTDNTVLLSSYAFDLCYTSLWGSILSGGTLHLLDNQKFFDPRVIIDYLAENPITYMKLTPSHFKMICSSEIFEENLESFELRLVILGGEVVDLTDIEKYLKRVPILFVNEYGPTEATVGTIAYNIDRRKLKTLQSNSIIGKGIENNSIYILDDTLSIVPEGTKGEICIAGLSLSTGYLNKPKLNKEKFVLNPYKRGAYDKYLYRTGDMAVQLLDGNIEFKGRTDNQLNIRGYRIELKEIECQIDNLEEVDKSAVITIDNHLGNKQLVAFVVLNEELNPNEIKAKLGSKLPSYMIPNFVSIDEFPLTLNGKVDRNALANSDEMAQRSYKAPVGETELLLVGIWSEILELDAEGIGRNSDFFELGGHSLLAIDLTSKINTLFSKEVSLAEIFECSTIKTLSEKVDSHEVLVLEEKQELMLLKQNEGAENNLFFIHDASGVIDDFKNLIQSVEGNNCYGLNYDGEGCGPKNTSVNELATSYIAKIKKVQPEGPYSLISSKSGGVLVYEIARQFRALGSSLGRMVIINAEFSLNQFEQRFLVNKEKNIIESIIGNEDLQPYDESSIETLWNSFVESDNFQQMRASDVLEQIPENFKDLIPENSKNGNKEIITAVNTIRTLKAVCDGYEFDGELDADVLFIKTSDSDIVESETLKLFKSITFMEVEGDYFSILDSPETTKISNALSEPFLVD